MKKFFSLITVLLAILLMCTAVYAEGDVEISFKVGDSTLLINGKPTTVVTPYVVGEGTTLVPVRVITEAFGAKVDWDNDTRTAILEYEGVKINLQIGNKVAEVNGKAETLLAAPELTNGSTMVPLRFISETFNAVVTYDEKTEGITVVKKASEDGSTVVGLTDSKHVGDSHFGWVMEKPADMQIEERYFDGTYTAFVYDDSNYIEIDIVAADPEYDINKDFENAKEAVEGLSLIKAEKDSTADVQKIHIQAKNQKYYSDIQRFVTKKYSIIVHGSFSNEDTAKRDMWLNTLTTFRPEYKDDDTHDLSNVKGEVRNFDAKHLNMSFDVPKDLYMLSDEDAVNEFNFYSIIHDDNISDMNVVVYSKSAVKGAEALAKNDYNRNKSAFSPQALIFSDSISKRDYNEFSAFEYSFEYNTSVAKGYSRDVFFELGDYVYNVSVTLKSTYGDTNAFVDKIINSVKIKEIDSEEVGVLMRNEPDMDGTFTAEPNGFKLTVPKAYEETIATNGAVYFNRKNGITLSFVGNKFNDATYSEIKDTVKNFEKVYKSEEDYEIISETSDVTIGRMKFATTTFRQKTDDGYVYTQMYANEKYSFVAMYPETAYFDNAIKEVKGIIGSVK